MSHTLFLRGRSLTEGQRELRGTCSGAQWERPGIQHHTVDSSRPCGPIKSGICWKLLEAVDWEPWRGPAKREVQAKLGRGGKRTGSPEERRKEGGAGGGPGPGAGQAAIESGRAGRQRAQSQRESQQSGTGVPRQSWARQVGLACGATVIANLF